MIEEAVGGAPFGSPCPSTFFSYLRFCQTIVCMRMSIFISAVFMFIGVIIFMSGYHAIDTAWNMKNLANSTDINYFGRVATADNLYMQGLAMSLAGFGMSVCSALAMGVKSDVRAKSS